MFKLIAWAAKSILAIGVCVGCLVWFIGPQRAAAFTSTAFSVVGIGTGVTLGSLPEFASGVSVGQSTVDSNYSKSMRSKLRGNCVTFNTCQDERPTPQDRAERKAQEDPTGESTR